jgi:hypothetical protein
VWHAKLTRKDRFEKSVDLIDNDKTKHADKMNRYRDAGGDA